MTNESAKPDGTQVQSRGSQVSAKEVTFADIEPGMTEGGSQQNMDFLLDIPLEISVELGRTKITVGDLLKLSQGSVVELERSTDQPLEIYVNRKLMAQGEVVVVNEKFGIRLTNVISPGDRVKTLT
jgi:flagellar motor switch protein FliN/FliY